MELIDVAATLHKRGMISPNTYCIDLDMVRRNAEFIKKAADENGITLYFMTKQFGRNPAVAKAIVESGIEKAVAVNMEDARVLYKNGIKIGHIGHLVQIPKCSITEALSMKPDVITCFSLEKAMQINDAAKSLGIIQDILIRVLDKNSFIYPGQAGGIYLEKLENAAHEISKLKNVNIAGVTSFPCFLFNEKSKAIEVTPNMNAVLEGSKILNKMGFNITQINAPSANCVSSMPLVKNSGATHAEPGHAFTGTTPLHAVESQVEKPAIVYVSEVSHIDGDRAYVFGGGFYSRSGVKRAYIPEKGIILDAESMVPGTIDYYGAVKTGGRQLNVGDMVLYAFRTQIFVTNSKVAVIEGIGSKKPMLRGIYNSLGDELV